MTIWYDFDEVDAFTVGTIGRPGDRTFFLQVRRGSTHVTIKCEKQQAAGVAQHLRRLLSDLPEPTERPMPGAMELTDSLEAAFVLGPVGLGYNRESDMVLVQLDEVPDFDDDGEPIEDDEDSDRGHVRLLLSRSQVVAFCAKVDEVVSAGRATCRWCSRPIDPDGHACPRMN